MATNIQHIIDNLTAFYDFSGKNVIHVGAGGGQIIGYANLAKSVLAVDTDAEAIEHLREAVQTLNLSDIFTIKHRDLMEIDARADVAFFEFCLHEMAEPYAALAKASGLASDVVVLDHDKDSSWAWYACETEKLQKSWGAVHRFNVIRGQAYNAVQHFENYNELFNKFRILGKEALDRIKSFENEKNIEIDMDYRASFITDINL